MTKREDMRERILNGNLWKIIATLSVPLAVFSVFNFIYGFIDIILAAQISGYHTASLLFVDEIRNAVNAFGTALAAAGCVVVARLYGAKENEEARKNAAATFLVTIIISLIVVAVTVGLSYQILRLAGANDEIIAIGQQYYNIQMISTALVAINAVFFGLEKAKGNTKIVLWLNIVAMIIKLVLSLIFVYGLNITDIVYLAYATLISQGILTLIAVIFMFNKKNVFQIKITDIRYFSWKIVKPILILAIPIFFGRFFFNMGKVVLNVMVIDYSLFAVAALGIAFRLHGLFSSTSRVFEESGMMVASQNIGNKRLDRAYKTFWICISYGLIICLIGFGINYALSGPLLRLLSDNELERRMTMSIFHWEHFSMISSSIIAIISGFFIAFKKTKVTMVFSLWRLFVARLPILWLFWMFLPVGPEYVYLIGITMFISNTTTALLAIGCVWYFIHKLRNYGYEGLLIDGSYINPALQKQEEGLT